MDSSGQQKHEDDGKYFTHYVTDNKRWCDFRYKVGRSLHTFAHKIIIIGQVTGCNHFRFINEDQKKGAKKGVSRHLYY